MRLVWLVVIALAACSGGGSGADAGNGPGADAAGADAAGTPGSWDDPIVIDRLPFTHSADTRTAAADAVDAYSCAPQTDESGGEVVYRLALPLPLRVRASVIVDAGADVNVHILSAPSGDACDDRGDSAAEWMVGADAGWIVVNTYAGTDGVPRAGAYQLTVAEVVDSGSCTVSPIVCEDGDGPTPDGVPVEPAGLGGCPAGMTMAGSVCIDRWEAALVQVDAAGDRPWSPFLNPGTTRVRAISAPDLVPQGYVNQTQAATACAEAGKRLCTDSEWLRACQGAAGHTYPYGDSRQPGLCNDARSCHPAIQFFETSASWIWSALGNSCIAQLPAGLALTGSNAGCVSDDGVYDMMGNVHEWTADPAGTFRGGFYVDTSINGEGCLYATTAHDVSHWDYSTGFRCCADP